MVINCAFSDWGKNGAVCEGSYMNVRQKGDTPFEVAHLLYVDDERQSLKYFERALAGSACVVTCLTADTALDFLRSTTTEFDGIIADQRMPNMTGDALLSEVAQTWPNLVRILTTAYHDSDLLQQLTRAGIVDRIILKPWNTDDLSDMVLDAIKTVRRLRRPTARLDEAPDATAVPIRLMTIGLGPSNEPRLYVEAAVEAQSASVLRRFVTHPEVVGASSLRECLSWAITHLSETQVFYFNAIPKPLIPAQTELVGALLSELVREILLIMHPAGNVVVDVFLLESHTGIEFNIRARSFEDMPVVSNIDHVTSVPQLLARPSILLMGIAALHAGGKLTMCQDADGHVSAILKMPKAKEGIANI